MSKSNQQPGAPQKGGGKIIAVILGIITAVVLGFTVYTIVNSSKIDVDGYSRDASVYTMAELPSGSNMTGDVSSLQEDANNEIPDSSETAGSQLSETEVQEDFRNNGEETTVNPQTSEASQKMAEMINKTGLPSFEQNTDFTDSISDDEYKLILEYFGLSPEDIEDISPNQWDEILKELEYLGIDVTVDGYSYGENEYSYNSKEEYSYDGEYTTEEELLEEAAGYAYGSSGHVGMADYEWYGGFLSTAVGRDYNSSITLNDDGSCVYYSCIKKDGGYLMLEGYYEYEYVDDGFTDQGSESYVYCHFDGVDSRYSYMELVYNSMDDMLYLLTPGFNDFSRDQYFEGYFYRTWGKYLSM